MGTATQFTDDAYNSNLKGKQAGFGTLVGNWYEESQQREGTGEGRTVPQRHVRRSGLLKDFTRLPSDGFRIADDTFERLYGHRKYAGLNIRSTIKSLLYTSTFGPFSTVSTSIFASKY